MLHRRAPFVLTGMLLLAACGGSSDEAVDSTTTAPPTTIDLTTGLFTRDDAASSVTTTAVEDATIETTNEATPGTPTTLAPGDPAVDAPAGTTGEDSVSAATPSDQFVGAGQGLVTIGTVTYPFDATTCTLASDAAEIGGTGVASDGTSFDASIFYAFGDTDGDGTPDTTLEIDVTTTSADGGAAGPNFYGFVSPGSSGQDLTADVQPPSITGGGSIVDVTGVAFDGASAPITFEAQCG